MSIPVPNQSVSNDGANELIGGSVVRDVVPVCIMLTNVGYGTKMTYQCSRKHSGLDVRKKGREV